MSGRQPFERLCRGYRLLLHAYPRRFRLDYGPDLVRAFRLRCVQALESGGAVALLVWLVRAVVDVLWSGLLERLSGLPVSVSRSGDSPMVRFIRDLRFALRLMIRQPGHAATLVLTLAVGTGSTIALFSVLDAALLRPLPYPHADRLMLVHRADEDLGMYGFGIAHLPGLRERVSGLEPVVGFTASWEMALTGQGAPRRVEAAFVSDGTFPLLGVTLVQGRAFDAAEHASGGPRAVVVGAPFWNRHFGEGVALAGQTVTLDGESYAIVGVAEAFALPITASVVRRDPTPAELWIPLAANPLADVPAVPVVNVVGRLAPGWSLEAARAEITEAGRGLALEHPETLDRPDVRIAPLGEVVTAGVRRTVLTLFAASAFLLLIACVNVANLLLARLASRRQEMVLRLSLGAGRRRLLEQLLCESLLLGTVGSAVGLGLAWMAHRAVPAGALPLPPSATVGMDGRVAVFAVLLSVGTTVVFGLLPAVQALPRGATRTDSRVTRRGGRVRHALVAAEAALAVTLLIGAGLFARSLWNLARVDPGFSTESLVHVPVTMDARRHPSSDDRRAFMDELLPAIAAVPGVSGVAAVNRLPLGGANVYVGVEAEGWSSPDGSLPQLDRRVATPGYFEVMGIGLAAGRDFGAVDDRGGAPAAIVNEAFVRRFWPDRRGVGERLRLMLRGGPGPWLEVVGVVGDVRHHGLGTPPEPEIYVPWAQAAVASMTVVLTADDPGTTVPAVRDAIWAIDPDLPLDGAGPVAELVTSSVAEPRLRALMLNGFAGLALLLAAIGIYGVMSYSVAERSRETGVRMALGAQRSDVLARVMGEALRTTALGLVTGLVGAWALGRLVGSLLFGVEPTDASTFLGVTAVLFVVAAAASYLPARRATRVDPMIAIRGD